MEKPAQEAVHLLQARCAACGTSYHVPNSAAEPGRLCPICLKAPRRAMLYQVLP